MIESHDYTIIHNESIAENMYKLSIYAPDISSMAIPGQFVQIKIPNRQDLILRRPISINYTDTNSGIVELVYQIVGAGTKILSTLTSGNTLNVLGPLGQGFDIADAKNVYLVGGGCGVAPLRFISKKWPHLKVDAFLGFRSLSSVYQREEFTNTSEKVFLATEDGSLGNAGYVTDLVAMELKNDKPDLILACGPMPMLKIIQGLVKKHNIPCQISLEERMGCGIGGCLVCSCAIGKENWWQYKRVCADGPVFRSEEVLWDV